MTSNICRVSSISCLLLHPAAQTKPPRRLRLLPPPMAGCASAALPYVPSNIGQSLLYSPTRHVILRQRQPQHAPAPEPVNPRTPLRLRMDRCIFNGSYSFRPRPRRRPLPCGLGSLAMRGAPPSCVVNVVNNREEQGDDCTWRGCSRDPPASWQYASKCLYSTSPKIWFLLMVGHLGLTPLST